MLFEIAEDIDESEFGSALFTLGSLVPKGQLKNMETIFDLFLYLEKKDELSAENTEILPKVLKAIDRSDLIVKVTQYQNNYSEYNATWPDCKIIPAYGLMMSVCGPQGNLCV